MYRFSTVLLDKTKQQMEDIAKWENLNSRRYHARVIEEAVERYHTELARTRGQGKEQEGKGSSAK